MRVFAAATPEGWRVLPSAFCRVAEREGADPSEMRAGIRSADVWVLSDTPVDTPTLVHASTPRIRRIAGHLPSRAADNLFWFGRYLERAEAVIRLVQAHLGVFSEAVAADASGEEGAPTALAIRALLKDWGSVSAADLGPAALAQEALSGKTVHGSALSHVMEARRIAASLRERLPKESWRALADLRDTLVYAEAWAPTEAQLFGKAERALGHLAALTGLIHENMGHAAGWRFADIGRRIERAINTCSFALRFCGEDVSAEDLGVMLSLADSQIAYGARYLVGVSRNAVCDMAVLDPNNPRSVAYQLQAITAHLDVLPALAADGLPEPHRRRALALATTLQTAEADEFDAEALERFETDLEGLADRIAGRYFPNGPDALRPEKLTGLA
jgi:uncharacterized alpha-E superfamily protein